MKYALITDIHANLEALQAVLQAVDREHPDAQLVCLGDIVGYGPDPAACIDLLRERAVPCIRGNHEEMVLGLRDFSRCVSAGIKAARWTRRQLDDSQRRFLSELPIWRPISAGLAICHGDLASADTYISDPDVAEAALAQLLRQAPTARVLACGHTHFAALYTEGSGRFGDNPGDVVALEPARRYVLNPGAVGQARDGTPLARYAVLDLEHHRAAFPAVAYDHPKTEHKMRRAGLLGGVVMLPPSGLSRRIERARTRWERHWAEQENRRLGYRPRLGA